MVEPRENKPANDAPAPPPAPRVFVAPDEPENPSQAGTTDAQQAGAQAGAAQANTVTPQQQRNAKRRRVSVSTVIGIVAIIAVIAGAYFGWQAFNSAYDKPADTRLGDTVQAVSGASGTSEDSSESSAEVAAAKQAVQSQLNALASDEDGVFRAVVNKFISAYDAGVSQGSYSLSDIGITDEDLAPLLRSGFECKVSKADVYNGTAWVTVSVTSKNVSNAADAFTSNVVGLVANYSDEESYKAALKDAFTSAIEKQQVRTTSVLLTVPGAGDTWQLDDANVESLLGTAWYS